MCNESGYADLRCTDDVIAFFRYQSWLADKKSVHKSWADAFEKMHPQDVAAMTEPVAVEGGGGGGGAALTPEEQFDYTRVTNLIRAYRVRGHQKASLDPLQLHTGATLTRDDPPELEKEFFGFSDGDLDKVFHLGSAPESYRTLVPDNPSPTLREIIAKLESCYSENIGYQYMYGHDEVQKAWIRDRIENVNKVVFDRDTKQAIMGELIKSDGFEQFLIRRYAAEKRFGLDVSTVEVTQKSFVVFGFFKKKLGSKLEDTDRWRSCTPAITVYSEATLSAFHLMLTCAILL